MRAVLALVLGGLLWASAQPSHADWHQQTRAIMGTRIHVELYTEDPEQGEALVEAVMDEMHRIDHAFSSYKDDSELSRLNQQAPTQWVAVSDELFDLLLKARRVSELSEGAFDITFASVGRYYDYREGKSPDDATVEAAVKAINYRYVWLDVPGQRVRYEHPQVYVALGGIAKGHAVDRAIALLQAAGGRACQRGRRWRQPNHRRSDGQALDGGCATSAR